LFSKSSCKIIYICLFLFCSIEATPPSPVHPGAGGRVELRVVVSPDVIQVQRGRTVELSCTVYGGDSNTNIYWVQEEPERVKYFKYFFKLKIIFFNYF
jgi:hypothetical protein